MSLDLLEKKLRDWQNVDYRMSSEGMEYCFMNYSEFEEIEDEEFHKLRESLISLMTEMHNLVDKRITNLTEQIGEHEEE